MLMLLFEAHQDHLMCLYNNCLSINSHSAGLDVEETHTHSKLHIVCSGNLNLSLVLQYVLLSTSTENYYIYLMINTRVLNTEILCKKCFSICKMHVIDFRLYLIWYYMMYHVCMDQELS